jgi:hypothetical protein
VILDKLDLNKVMHNDLQNTPKMESVSDESKVSGIQDFREISESMLSNIKPDHDGFMITALMQPNQKTPKYAMSVLEDIIHFSFYDKQKETTYVYQKKANVFLQNTVQVAHDLSNKFSEFFRDILTDLSNQKAIIMPLNLV